MLIDDLSNNASNEVNYEVGSYIYSIYHEESGNTLEGNLDIFYIVLGSIVEKFYPMEYLYLINYLKLI